MDDEGSRAVESAIDLVRGWLREVEASADRTERREAARLRALGADRPGIEFAMAFFDRVLRPESDGVAAEQLRALVHGALPEFLSLADRALLRVGSRLARLAPSLVMPLARRRLRGLVGGLIVERADPGFAAELRRLETGGFRVNVNLLGELVLGNEEAARRHAATLALLRRDDVHTVSVKASSVASHLNLWAYEHTLERVKASLRGLLRAAAASRPARFVNLDMEEYKDLRLTLDAFMQLLDEPELRALEAGIVLQAYLPDSFAALQELVAWAGRRRAVGGAGIKVRIVKGANLAMERVEAALHGWVEAPYATKAETDANAKRLLDWAFEPARVEAVRIGVASHNLFDVAWARLLAEARGVGHRVELEMLKGMAPGVARTVRRAAGGLLLYTPVVEASDFASALAYLFRRFEENGSGENFLRRLFDLAEDEAAFAVERRKFEVAVAGRESVSAAPRRRSERFAPPSGFANVPDTDPTDPAARASFLEALAQPPPVALPPECDARDIERVVAAARAARAAWCARPPAERRAQLRRVGDEIAAARPRLVAQMAHEAGKTLAEGDREVSEAIDYARYYAERVPELERQESAAFEPLGVVVVAPPWNFPMAIPAGGVLAALAAQNTVVLKTAPQTPRSALAIAECCWAAGIPRDVLQFVRCPDVGVGEHLVGHRGIHGLVLTGSFETAEHFAALAPETPLFAETSGKNAVVILPDADLDLAVADLVASAFGHAGQKCSAASLAILVGDVGASARFRRQLVDATRSLIVGGATRPESVVGPLIGPPSEKLHRALTRLSPGERWLLEPRRLGAVPNLWSPGILEGVLPGSWFHQTEAFGPVLGLMRARDLDQALAFQNGVAYGLTGGIHTLDPAKAERWLARALVGNAYVNRGITGAVVERQPFGGWKRSVVGPGAKAGGPNYVAQLGHWRNAGLPATGKERLEAALRSDAFWWETEFAVEHDPAGLFCEANVFRYRPLSSLLVRVAADAVPVEVARVLAAVARVGSPRNVSVDPRYDGEIGGRLRREDCTAFAARIATERPERVRVVGSEPIAHVGPATFVDRRPVVDNGRIELARYLREQAVSRTLHRFGNLVAR